MDSGISTESDSSGLRHRYTPEQDSDWNNDVPYGGKVYLARKKRPDPLHVRAIEVGSFFGSSTLGIICFLSEFYHL